MLLMVNGPKSLPQQRSKVLRSIGDKLIENAELLGYY